MRQHQTLPTTNTNNTEALIGRWIEQDDSDDPPQDWWPRMGLLDVRFIDDQADLIITKTSASQFGNTVRWTADGTSRPATLTFMLPSGHTQVTDYQVNSDHLFIRFTDKKFHFRRHGTGDDLLVIPGSEPGGASFFGEESAGPPMLMDFRLDRNNPLSQEASAPQSLKDTELQLAQTRKQLEAERVIAEETVRNAESKTIRAANGYQQAKSNVDKSNSLIATQVLDQREKELRTAVRMAFEERWKLQDIRLKLASTEISELQAKHQRRRVLAGQIIDRRILELQNVDETTWEVGENTTFGSHSGQSRNDKSVTQVPADVNVLITCLDIDELESLSADKVKFEKRNASSIPENAVTSIEGIDGKSAKRTIRKGQIVVTPALMDTPSPAEFIRLKLEDAGSGKIVFAPGNYARRSSYPFSPILVSSIRRHIPDWAGRFVVAFNTKLADELNDGNVSQSTLNALNSIEYLMNVWDESDDWNLQHTAELLSEFVKMFTDSEDEHLYLAAQSSKVLGLISRGTGTLPQVISETPLLNEDLDRKWRLLNQMLLDGAESDWISQEHVRLRNLVRDAPYHAIQSLVTVGKIHHSSDTEHWAHALSTAEVFDAWTTSPRRKAEPALDPVLMVVLLEPMVGLSESSDNRISDIVGDSHPGYLFSRHVNDILSGTLHYRSVMHQALTNMYIKTSNKRLRESIEAVAQSAAAEARRTMKSSDTLQNVTTPPGADSPDRSDNSAPPTR